MDRRKFIKAVGAVSMLPLLPAIELPTPIGNRIVPADEMAGEALHILNDRMADTPGEWHQFAIVREATDFKFYVDGELVAENMMIEPAWNRGQIWQDLSEGLRKFPDANVSSIWAKETRFRCQVGDGMELDNTFETARSDFTLV